MEQFQEAVAGKISWLARFLVLLFDAEYLSADQLGENGRSGPVPQLVDDISRDSLVVGDDRKDIDGSLREPAILDLAVEFFP